MLRQLVLPESRAFTAYTGDDTAIHGAACYRPDRTGHLYKCRPPPTSDIMQPGDRRVHWLPIAVDGTSRHEAAYVHCTLVLRVLLCGINGTWDLVVQLTGKAPAIVARTMLQLVLDEARLAARTCTCASLNNDKANSKGKVRMECAAAIHFILNRGWEKMMDARLQHPSVRQHQVGRKSESVRKTWWGNFASMCVYAWLSAWFSGADVERLRNHGIAMGTAHNELQWGKLLWTHLWIANMYYFAQKWTILSKFSCFAMEEVTGRWSARCAIAGA